MEFGAVMPAGLAWIAAGAAAVAALAAVVHVFETISDLDPR